MENRIGNILLQSNKIKKEELDIAIKEQREKEELFGETLSRLGFATPKDIALALSEQLKIPYIELGEDVNIGQEEVKLIPEHIARKFCILPFKIDGKLITIIMKDPLDIEAIDIIRVLTKLEVRKAVNTEEIILSAIKKYYKEETHIESNLQEIVKLENGKSTEDEENGGVDADELRILANDVPVVRFVNLLLLQAVRDRASDIHFEPSEKEIAVRLRIDGKLRIVTPPPKSLYQAIVTRIKILSNMNIAERRLPQDGRFKFKIGKRSVDIRVSSLPEVFGEKLVLRVLDKSALLVDMKDIGFDNDMLNRFQRSLRKPHGIILLTGPTGSGKTTTLYSALNFLRSPETNIQTVEDPIEYFIEGINQMQVKEYIGLTFANALRSILRQDPDIVMIGEIRDLDTAKIAMRAALTGHLVLSTLHTNDTTSAVSRLKDIGIDPYLIADTVNLIIAQRLVRVICKKCREQVTPPANSLKLAASIYPDAYEWRYYKGKGCQYCYHTGYKGRTGIFEFLEATDSIKETILAKSEHNLLRKKAIELGMMTLLANGFNKIKQEVTTIEEILSVCSYSDAL
ncbi:MAG: ATPase, T2SS/T4P/T4SS family [Candidatus Omnitrophota bacterium]